MIEAQEEKAAALSTLPFECEIVLLGEQDGKPVTFHVMETGSSIYPERSNVRRMQRTMTTRTLDAIYGKHPQLKPPLLLKLDVQGAEPLMKY
jgi:FkbM family methyltransferase